jgi:Fe-coproporphyrin III synthase
MNSQLLSIYKKSHMDIAAQADVITGPLQIGIDITNHCMLQCLHCFNRSAKIKRIEMTDAELNRLADQIVSIGPQQICICGGEPLIRKRQTIEFGRKIKESGILIGMVSNGFLLTSETSSDLKKAGFDQIQISLDGFRDAHDMLRGKKGAFDKAVSAIRNLSTAGMAPIASFAPTKYNIGIFPEYIEFAKSIGIKEVRVQPLMPIGEALINADIFPTDAQYFELNRFIKSYNFDYLKSACTEEAYNSRSLNEVCLPDADFSILWGDPVDHIIRFSKVMTKPTYSLHIGASGNIYVSPYFPVVVGNVKKHSLHEYWEAGLHKVWELRMIQEIAKQVRAVSHLGKISPPAFFSDELTIDIVEDSDEDIETKTTQIFGS